MNSSVTSDYLCAILRRPWWQPYPDVIPVLPRSIIRFAERNRHVRTHWIGLLRIETVFVGITPPEEIRWFSTQITEFDQQRELYQIFHSETYKEAVLRHAAIVQSVKDGTLKLDSLPETRTNEDRQTVDQR